MTRRRVAIIGAGVSGVALAAQLARLGPGAPGVTLIERGPTFGPGLAYGTKHKAHLLNVRASNMSVFADKPDDFARWLTAHGGGDATAFARRERFGAYAQDVLRRAERARLFGRAVKRVRGEAVAVRRAGDAWAVTLVSGATAEADAVVLALGNPEPASLPVFTDAGIDLIDPWDPAALRRLSRNADVLLLGAGLTMFDVALTLGGRGGKGVIYALSRRGLAPRTHLDPPRAPPGESIDLPTPLSQALHAFRREAARMAERGEPWQLAFDRLRRDTPALWRRLPLEAQRRFLRHLRPWWDVHRHRAAPEVGAQIEALRASGKLRVLAGEIVSAAREGRAIHVQHRQRGSLVRHKFEVAGVVNCTGANLDLTQSRDPLIVQLLSEGVAAPHPNGRGFDIDAEGRLVDAVGAAHAGLFVLGPMTQGAFWESTAVPEIRTMAAALATLIAAP